MLSQGGNSNRAPALAVAWQNYCRVLRFGNIAGKTPQSEAPGSVWGHRGPAASPPSLQQLCPHPPASPASLRRAPGRSVTSPRPPGEAEEVFWQRRGSAGKGEGRTCPAAFPGTSRQVSSRGLKPGAAPPARRLPAP